MITQEEGAELELKAWLPNSKLTLLPLNQDKHNIGESQYLLDVYNIPVSVLRTLGTLTREILTLATICFIGTEIVSNLHIVT